MTLGNCYIRGGWPVWSWPQHRSWVMWRAGHPAAPFLTPDGERANFALTERCRSTKAW